MREGRRPDELRPIDVVPDFVEQADGSVLISFGKTRVLCTATIEEGVPRWLVGSGRGWLTAEYGMLPASTGERTAREALRAAYDLEKLGERTVWLDCDVIQADGGTRTAAISGAWIALARAAKRKGLPAPAERVGAISVGIVEGEPLLDLDYGEDSSADVDMNVVMRGDGRLIEVQATAERNAYTREELDRLIDLASGGIESIFEIQAKAAA